MMRGFDKRNTYRIDLECPCDHYEDLGYRVDEVSVQNHDGCRINGTSESTAVVSPE